jgi:non-ribosomal peptide synthetase component E (peptide arylation enzyme)
MSGVKSRLASLVGHLTGSTPAPFEHRLNNHTLSPTFFLPRAAAIEPDVRGHWRSLADASAVLRSDDDQLLISIQAEAVYHVTANNKILRRSYSELADRARGLAYYLKKRGFKRVGILSPNTPAFLESIFGIAAAGAINVGKIFTSPVSTNRMLI